MSAGAEWWREIHEELAAKIERGEPLTKREAKRAAAAIRRSAADPPGPPKRGRGAPRKFVAEDARMLFDALREEPKFPEDPKKWTALEAIAYCAEVFGVSDTAISEAVYPRRVGGNSDE